VPRDVEPEDILLEREALILVPFRHDLDRRRAVAAPGAHGEQFEISCSLSVSGTNPASRTLCILGLSFLLSGSVFTGGEGCVAQA